MRLVLSGLRGENPAHGRPSRAAGVKPPWPAPLVHVPWKGHLPAFSRRSSGGRSLLVGWT
jgi:hypothetical protein